jgi:hypothetical protein
MWNINYIIGSFFGFLPKLLSFFWQILRNPFGAMLFIIFFNILLKLFSYILPIGYANILSNVFTLVFFMYYQIHREIERWMSLSGYGSRIMLGILQLFASAWLVSLICVRFFSLSVTPNGRNGRFSLVLLLTFLLVAIAFREYMKRLQGYLRLPHIPKFRDWCSPNWLP